MPATALPRSVVEAELSRALASPEFAPSQRQQRFLHYLVHHTLAGAHATLKETVLAVEVFGRNADRFDPRQDSIVRVEAGRLRQRLARYYAGSGQGARMRIDLPVGSYVPLLQAHEPARDGMASRRARDLVERGENFLRQTSEEAMRKALQRFQSAVREAPGYARAHKGLARACTGLVACWHEPASPWIADALAAFKQAAALDPSDAETVMLIGGLHHRYDHDWSLAQPWLQRAVEMSPNNAIVRCGRGFYLVLAGADDAAEQELQLARQLDPHLLQARQFMAGLRVAQRRWDDADKELEALLDIAPGYFSAQLTVADVQRYRGDLDAALTSYRRVQQAFPTHAAGWLGEAQVLALQGQCSERAIAQARERMGGTIPTYSTAKVLACAGRWDDTLALLRESAAIRDPGFLFGNIEPAFDPLREDPTFVELYRRVRVH
jgi:tetratricopeptide (TPR) repeat protein